MGLTRVVIAVSGWEKYLMLGIKELRRFGHDSVRNVRWLQVVTHVLVSSAHAHYLSANSDKFTRRSPCR